jgi:hypothetical protein
LLLFWLFWFLFFLFFAGVGFVLGLQRVTVGLMLQVSELELLL